MSTRRGRPSVSPGEPTYPVTTRLPQSMADQVMRIARREGVDVADVVRSALRDFCSEKSTIGPSPSTVENA